MSTCQHRNTTFSRDICPDPCGVMHTFCRDCSRLLETCAHDVRKAAVERGRQLAAGPKVERATSKTTVDGFPVGTSRAVRVAAAAERERERAVADELTRELDTVYADPWASDKDASDHYDRAAVSILTASGGDVHGQTTAEGPNRSETTAANASPELAEPTDVDIRPGLEIASLVRNTSQTLAGRVEGARAIAAALAAERAAIHARYEAVAAACDEDAVTPDPSESLTWAAAAARIRQVAAQ